MLHACDQRFDVTENFENFLELNKAKVVQCWDSLEQLTTHMQQQVKKDRSIRRRSQWS